MLNLYFVAFEIFFIFQCFILSPLYCWRSQINVAHGALWPRRASIDVALRTLSAPAACLFFAHSKCAHAVLPLCIGLFLAFNFYLSRPDARTMDICIGWPTVTDLLSFVCRCQPVSIGRVCVCVSVRRSHILFCYFLRSTAVAANISVWCFFFSLLPFFLFSSFSQCTPCTQIAAENI